MMAKTKIDWADKVWNPVTGCTKVSEGCRHCYAERIAKRFWRNGIMGDNYRPFNKVRYHHERLIQPLHWKKPARIFVDSMGDLFHEDVSNKIISYIFGIMIKAPKHTFIILTKRAHRMYEYLKDYQTIIHNIWLGVSVEDQKTADERIPLLLQTPAAMRFVSVEPMLESIDLRGSYDGAIWPWAEALAEGHGVEWVICGCESGPKARPMNLDWVRILKNQCKDVGVPFFFKQAMINGKLVKMPNLDGRVWNEYPENHVNL